MVTIEPCPKTYAALQNNIKLNNLRNVIALNVAALDRNGTVSLFLGDVAGRHSTVCNLGLGKIEVPAKTLDHLLLEELELQKVDLVKIDVEGAECEVLDGMKKVAQKYRPKIVLEVWNVNLSKIRSLLRNMNYNVDTVIANKMPVYLVCSSEPQE